jgi:flagellar basal-body rod protein FlgB
MGFLESAFTEMIDQKMRYSSQRVSVLAQNIANVDTPGFKAKDVQAPDFNQMVEENQRLLMTRTNASHLATTSNLSAPYYAVIPRQETYETKPNGNNVTLEQEMMHLSTTSFDHQLALNLHESVDKRYKMVLGLPVN